MTDSTNRSSTQTVTITVGNTRPQLEVEGPVQGGFYEWTDTVATRSGSPTPRTATVNCNEVNLVIGLGHDEHSHPIDQKIGCEGDVVTDVIPEGHSPNSRIFYVLRASYADHGAAGQRGARRLDRRSRCGRSSGRRSSTTARRASSGRVDRGASAGRRVGSISRGDWWAYEDVNLRNIDSITARVSSGLQQQRADRVPPRLADGPKIGEVSCRTRAAGTPTGR